MLDVAIVFAGPVGLLMLIVHAGAARRRRNTLAEFAAATAVLKHIAEQPRDVATRDPGRVETPSVRVLHDVAVLRLDRSRAARQGRAARRPPRPDAAALARRPVIASLPSATSPKGG